MSISPPRDVILYTNPALPRCDETRQFKVHRSTIEYPLVHESVAGTLVRRLTSGQNCACRTTNAVVVRDDCISAWVTPCEGHTFAHAQCKLMVTEGVYSAEYRIMRTADCYFILIEGEWIPTAATMSYDDTQT